MKRVYCKFKSIALFIGLSVFLFSCHKDDVNSDPNNTPITQPTPTGTFPENFEYGAKSSFLPGSVALSSGSWYFDDAIIGYSAADAKDDKQTELILFLSNMLSIITTIRGHGNYGFQQTVEIHGQKWVIR